MLSVALLTGVRAGSITAIPHALIFRPLIDEVQPPPCPRNCLRRSRRVVMHRNVYLGCYQARQVRKGFIICQSERDREPSSVAKDELPVPLLSHHPFNFYDLSRREA